MENKTSVCGSKPLCAVIPFLFYLMFAIMQGVQIGWAGTVVLLFEFMLPVLIIIGLLKGMPRWSLPVLGLSLAILNYIQFGIVGFVFWGVTATPPLFRHEILARVFRTSALPFSSWSFCSPRH